MGINSAFRAEQLAEQAPALDGRRSSTAALDGLLELDAIVKGAPGRGGGGGGSAGWRSRSGSPTTSADPESAGLRASARGGARGAA